MRKKSLSVAGLALASVCFSSPGFAAVTIQENAAGFCGFEGVISSVYAGYTGDGYVDIVNTGGKGITYKVEVTASGNYPVTFRYANTGSTSSALTVNGSSGSLSFPQTGSLASWSTTGKTINLRAGVNVVQLRATGSQPIANIDSVSFGGGVVAANCNGSGYSSSLSASSVSSVLSSNAFSSTQASSVSSSRSSILWSSASSLAASLASSSSSAPPLGEVPDFTLTGFASVAALGVAGTSGGAGGEVVSVTSFEQLAHYVTAAAPYVIHVQGDIQPPGGAYVKLNVASNKSIIGVGSGANLRLMGFRVGGTSGCADAYNPATAYVSNVVIRNLTFRDVYDAGTNPDADAVTVECFAHHVWVDHNTFIYSAPNSSLMGRIDGAVDVKRGGDWVTVSWNHFYHYNKTMLLGHVDSNSLQDSGRLHVTYHHNFFENTYQRHPRVRFGKAHIFNNYVFNDKTGPSRQISYIALAGPESELYLEANHIHVDSGELYVVSEDSDRNAKVTFTNDNLVRLFNPTAEWFLEVNNGLAFNPRNFYQYTVNSVDLLPDLVPRYSGAGKVNGLE